jgi:hypothetical protein
MLLYAERKNAIITPKYNYLTGYGKPIFWPKKSAVASYKDEKGVAQFFDWTWFSTQFLRIGHS